MMEGAEALAEAVKDLCWRATPYGQTADGDTYAYIVTKGAMHRLIGAAQGAGIPASFRATPAPETIRERCVSACNCCPIPPRPAA